MKKLNRRWLIAWCVVFLVLDAAAAVVLGTVIRQDRQNAVQYVRDTLAQEMEIAPETEEAVYENRLLSALGEANGYVHMYSEPEAREGRIALMLSNGEENPYAVKMQLMLFSTGEVIAETGLVDPGWRVEESELQTALAAGEYYCMARLYFYTVEGNVLLGTMGRQVLLRVK